MTKAQVKAAERRVEQAYYRTCSGIEISMMDIGKVFTVGLQALKEGCHGDDELGVVVRAYVETIRKN